jgi:endonuclease YncB( thermonuclease family)
MTKMTIVLLAGLLALALQAPAATKSKSKPKEPTPPAEVTGSVSRVIDGDTLWVKTAADDKPVVVRIEGVDAPEICQPGGKEAAAWLADLALNRNVTVKRMATDDWGRTVGRVFDGTRDIGDRMVRDGHAWSTRYKYDRGPYVAEERMAKSFMRGLHATEGALEPREFRKRHGACPTAQ